MKFVEGKKKRLRGQKTEAGGPHKKVKEARVNTKPPPAAERDCPLWGKLQMTFPIRLSPVFSIYRI